MAKDAKFGTFGGVYTPSVLTILGVIMYLRLPWVVGNAGLETTLAIIAVAHVISVCTGLSISSIATDKNVGAGGPYYIVSRSMGLPIGGTLGLSLFVGLAFSISLYVIGFCDSLLRYFDLEASVTNIRIAGSATLVLLTVVTLISTAFAIKTQYVIFSLIGLSLISIGLAPDQGPLTPLADAARDTDDIGELFGIFFPAVTGFTAGVNMSGDLRNPKRSIPSGTMAAIATGLVVYVGLAVFLHLRVPAEQLVKNPSVLVDVAGVGWLVVGGIWGATLSSALGSIMGAPRILQALSVDRITPGWFAKGYGKTNEPRNALVLAFLIGWSGILIAELDVIARIVSMVFLTTYGFLNISCALESWASPDFRPDFKIPKSVSLLGALTSLVVMIQLDLGAMAGSVALMAAVYAWLKRKQLRLDSGDAWEGFWASLVRAGLYRLSQERQQRRNWRPNVLLFRSHDESTRTLRAFAESLVGGNGLLTDFRLLPEGTRKAPISHAPRADDSGETESRVGVFRRDLSVDDTYQVIQEVCRYHGFAGLRPNTVLLDWREYRGHPEQLARIVGLLDELDYNQLVYSRGESRQEDVARIDVWWKQGAGNLSFALALIRFITSTELYRHASTRFLLVSDDSANNDILRTRAKRAITEARVTAEVEMINNAREGLPVVEWVKRHSEDAALTIVGVDDDAPDEDRAGIARLEKELDALGPVLLVRANSGFAETLTVTRKVSHSLVPVAPESEQPITDGLATGDNPQVQARVGDLAERYQSAVLSLYEHAVVRLYVPQIELLRGVRAATERRAKQLEERLAGENPKKQRKLVNRIHNSFLLEVKKLFENFLDNELPAQRDALAARIEAFVDSEELRPADVDEVIWIREAKERFVASEDDSPKLRRFKRRRRVLAFFKRALPSYPVPTGLLEAHCYDRLLREVLLDTVERVTSDCHQLIVHLGKRLNEPDLVIELLRGLEEGQEMASGIEEHRQRSLEHLDELIADEKRRLEKRRARVISATRALLEGYAASLGRLDVYQDRRSLRVTPKEAQKLEADLGEMAEPWHDNQRSLVERALLSLEVSEFHHRLTAIVSREREGLMLAIRGGVSRDLDTLLTQLEALREKLQASDESAKKTASEIHFDYTPQFDPAPILERLTKETEQVVQDLPETVQTLDNDSIERLEEKGIAASQVEHIDLSVRPLMQFSVESELVGVLGEGLAGLPGVEQRASSVGHDVARLIAFQVTEYESEENQNAEEFGQHMLPAVDNGIERVTAERNKVAEALERQLTTLDERLNQVLVRTGVYELASSSDSFDMSVRRQRGRRAVTGVQGLFSSVAGFLRRTSVKSLYRLSTGLLLAKRLRQGPASTGSAVEQVIADVAANSPTPEVVEKLPYYYRQLFFGQATLNENFWVSRDAEFALAKAAVSNFKSGKTGCLIIQGERGSGKSALWQHLATRALERQPVYRVHPKAGGSSELRVFEKALSEAIGQPGAAVDLLRRLETGSVIVVDDFELWWERSPRGLEVVDLVLDLIDRFGDRCLFILCMNRQAYRLLARLRALDDRALGVVECGIVSAETLKRIISLRHDSTGVTYSLDGTEQGELGQWAIARLFAAHFHYSKGLIGPALQAWVTHIERCGKESIDIRRPTNASTPSFDELSVEQVAILVQLSLHKQLSVERLCRVVPGPRSPTLQLIASLRRMGLVVEPRPHVFELNRFIIHLLSDDLKNRGLLA